MLSEKQQEAGLALGLSSQRAENLNFSMGVDEEVSLRTYDLGDCMS
jgi:hypothetical protein